LCLQELKTQSIGDLTWLKTHFRYVYTNLSKHKKGYSGVALLCKEEPEWVETDFNRYDSEFIGSCPDDIAMEGQVCIVHCCHRLYTQRTTRSCPYPRTNSMGERSTNVLIGTTTRV
jgi:exonuclease III